MNELTPIQKLKGRMSLSHHTQSDRHHKQLTAKTVNGDVITPANAIIIAVIAIGIIFADYAFAITTITDTSVSTGEWVNSTNFNATGTYYGLAEKANTSIFWGTLSAPPASWGRGNLTSEIFAVCSNNTFVPYTGATGNIDIGSKNFTTTGFGQFAWVDKLESTAPATPPANTLRLFVEDIKGFSFYKYKDDTGMVRQLVRDSMILVKNVGGTNISAYRFVYATGSQDNIPTIALAKADNISTMPAIGVTIEAISNGSYGRVMQVGLVENINTNAYAEGNIVYVSDTTAGLGRNTPPLTPNLTQEMGTVLVKSATAGAVQIIARSVEGNEFGTINDFAAIGNLSTSQNVIIPAGKKLCFDGPACTKYIYYNGTSIITVG